VYVRKDENNKPIMIVENDDISNINYKDKYLEIKKHYNILQSNKE